VSRSPLGEKKKKRRKGAQVSARHGAGDDANRESPGKRKKGRMCSIPVPGKGKGKEKGERPSSILSCTENRRKKFREKKKRGRGVRPCRSS